VTGEPAGAFPLRLAHPRRAAASALPHRELLADGLRHGAMRNATGATTCAYAYILTVVRARDARKGLLKIDERCCTEANECLRALPVPLGGALHGGRS